MKKIKPCPFCGSRATLRKILIWQDFQYYVQCDNIKCLINSATCCRATPEEAIELWNHRFEEKSEDIRAMCDECDAWNKYKNYSQPEHFNPCTVCQEFDCTGCKFKRMVSGK